MQIPLFEQLMSLSGIISDQYADVLKQTDLLQTATYWHDLSKNTLELARRAVLVEYADDVKALGANEAVREARIQGITAEQQAHVDEFAAGVASCAHALKMANIALEALRCQLRILECAVAATNFDARAAVSPVAGVDPNRFGDVFIGATPDGEGTTK